NLSRTTSRLLLLTFETFPLSLSLSLSFSLPPSLSLFNPHTTPSLFFLTLRHTCPPPSLSLSLSHTCTHTPTNTHTHTHTHTHTGVILLWVSPGCIGSSPPNNQVGMTNL